jgi:acyl-coenzyme A synthetase/AMP-(fatty) acid ligase
MNRSAPDTPGPQGSTCKWLAHHASRRPTAVAVVHRDVGLTYRSLAAQVLEVLDDLTEVGIRRGQVVGVETGDRVLHLLILLAAEALGVATISVAPSELGPPFNLGRLCDRIIVSCEVALAEPHKLIVMPPDWLTDIANRAVRARGLDELERDLEPDALVRLIKSSGTTGVPKVMRMTHRVQQGVIRNTLLYAPSWVKSHPDYLCVYNFAVRAAHSRTLLTLQSGGTVHFTGADVLWDMIAAGTGNYLLFVTGDLERFVRTMPHGGGPFPLYLDVIGAEVPVRLRQEIRAKLTEHIMVTYSSNEVNRISVVGENNVGTLFPGVRIRIVDERGGLLPMGQRGLIRIQSDTMTDGYVNAPELTREVFVDGWFHTSDFGFQPSRRKLVVLGRDDDMLNIGGLKIAPGPIEQRLKAIDGVQDALVTGIDDHLQTRVLLVAVEMAPHADPAILAQLITPIVRAHVTFFQLAVLPEFPRTETGKIRREGVKELYRRQSQTL